MEWETVIGLEIHTQLATKSKIFSGASTAYGAVPNTQACAVDLGLPGVLPVFNKEALTMAIKFGLAIGAEVSRHSIFARKNYFYPDLPKGYQISQMDHPIVGKGEIDIELENGKTKTIGVTRAHLEEDAGKSLHDIYDGMTGIDLNRAGTPLLEIVSEPDMRSAKEAVAYMKKIHSLVRYLEISDGNMQEGSFRCDANVSVRPKGQKEYGTRAELKNINSFKNVEKAINLEVLRQIEVIESGDKVAQETRLYDADKNETRSMRSKEEAMDYRYFPDPDLLPVEVTEAEIKSIQDLLPELPAAKQARFEKEMALSNYDAAILTADKDLASYFEQVVEKCDQAKLTANWVMGDLSGRLNKDDKTINESPVSAEMLAGMITRLAENAITSKMAKEIFDAMWNGEGDADAIIEKRGLKTADSGEVEKIIDEIIANNPDQVEQLKAGKGKVMGFFVGQVMKVSKGKADPAQVNKLLTEKLK
ncbi:Aspartyl-tRNA(Asn) amidotransferase subunit B @ Glutamyl-tRNA(Gln) amidotransferase subunit B [hydrothermal vent metagenome]|uniref:Aspartyl-tRNA(Asn) amidotransferase subunit B @ Glutamyl-tRNA(Gln) amidotransferase subunit B n=1 Tax=hydrothermal vent metagenome TaxID=652676 RepID=A0A3B1A2D4_9ZZZZ